MGKVLKQSIWLMGLTASLEAAADLPVIDFTAAANAAQEIAAWSQQAQQMQQEISTLSQQLQQVQMLYTSVTGGPESLKNLADLGNNTTLYQYLPTNYRDVLQSGFVGWQSIQQANQVADHLASGISGTGLKVVTERAMQISSNVAVMMAAYESAAKRIANLQILLKKVDATPDAKSIADLQGRIQAEQMLLQNESARLQLIGQMAALQRDQAEQKGQQAALAATGGQIPTNW